MRRLRPLVLQKQKKQVDYLIIILAIVFSLFGILMIFESSNVMAFYSFGNKYHFVKDHLFFFLSGIAASFLISYIPYKKYYYLSLPLLLLTIVFLVAVFIPGLGVKALGANRWLKLGFFRLQPSELAKLSLVVYLSAWFSTKEKGRLIPFVLLFSLIVGLVVLQPDLGTGVILISIALILYFLSGAPFFHFLILIPFLILTVLALAITSPYRFRRLTTFLNPGFDPLGASYHIRQILLSLGSGGLFGLGLGASRQKYQFLPEANTDSIFAIVGEEFGFVGTTVVILLYLFFLYRIYLIAKRAPDRQGFLLASGVLALFACQIIINLGAIVAIFPLTGVPLPFISYGGSNLMISLISVGIVLNISRHAVSHK